MICRFTIFMLLVFHSVGFGQLYNPSFEEGDASSGPFTEPTQWDCTNYAALHASFTPVLREDHIEPNMVTWSISGPAAGSSFLLLSTGDTEGMGSDPSTVYEASAQSGGFLLDAGSTLSLWYVFGTCDWYADTCQISLIPADPNNYPNTTQTITLLSAKVVNVQRGQGDAVEKPDIPEYGSSGGWQSLSFTVGSGQEGYYKLKCVVSDTGDAIYKSYLAVDGITYCRPSANYGDINRDCQIDLDDFSLFASAWLTTCFDDPNSPQYDPNSPCDPNIPTHASDLDHNWTVDTDDLGILSDHWLEDFWAQ